eukprot:1345813-Prymnesium_polylepis.1
MRVCHAWQQALSAVECTDAHAGYTPDVSTTLTLGRDERSPPDALRTACAGGTQQSPKSLDRGLPMRPKAV